MHKRSIFSVGLNVIKINERFWSFLKQWSPISILIVGLDKSKPILIRKDTKYMHGFHNGVVTDMLKPHFYIAHKIGIFCRHFKSWFG